MKTGLGLLWQYLSVCQNPEGQSNPRIRFNKFKKQSSLQDSQLKVCYLSNYKF